ncbi:MAG TPA: DegT/DnrJ/EryC1/StrS family aminotransferase [Bacteroidales bacterium]|nr:DegT/DnrJ/EryC1/StrS family aminotransferase [Bacteroidales bacterium]HOU95417.1 DegT/DnrJ/EryC1/StrS family aminotransferase [Bacteroidales bacterium]HQG36304.1 DegT/DnrJ/EryC1/StrS family aminotransferase [Bacteroidales bacterium]HQG52512.1 DegT/DnrJ/EryC1/StrS family aminotransferase [Bacteroidales bacterium]HQJ20063.1 DegT/DnrJ/EryC1/StrS family aminotransferase [Bacteroidales bacterium]
MKIPFSPPYIDQDVLNEVEDTLKSGWITTGPKVKSLEDEIARFVSIKNTLCVNSATSGLYLAMKWFGIGPGDEVIVPAYTYAATALAVFHTGAKPVLVDVNNDFNIDVESIKKLINHSTKAIIPVDFAGWPCDYDEILSVVTDTHISSLFTPHNEIQAKLGRILILSDAAHSLGAVYKNKPSGSITDISVFSLHAVKNVTTAEGGIICLSLPDIFLGEEVIASMRLMSLNGQTKDAYSKNVVGNWRYDIILPGFKMNMPDICAAIGLAQIRKYKNQLLPERKRIAMRYANRFQMHDWAIIPPLHNIDKETSYHIFALRIRGFSEKMRDLMIEEISKKDVSVNVHFIPLPLFKYFKDEGYSIDNFPIAYSCYCCEISLPIYPQLSTKMVDYIADVVIDSYCKIKDRK